MVRKTSVARRPRRANTRRRTSKKHPIHKRVALHPIFVFLLLCTGVLLAGWTLKTGATDIIVRARVAGIAPSFPAVITSPVENDRFGDIPVPVAGTCSSNSYVSIYSNGIILGSALCDSSNEFNLSVNLVPNANELIAHIYNLADEEGPESDPVNVYYDVPPIPPPGNPQSGGSSAPIGQGSGGNQEKVPTEPFLITTDFTARGFYVGDKVEWPIKIIGGTAPYAINVDWGDGSNSVYSRSKAGAFDISHIYSHPGNKEGSYIIKLSAADNTGRHSYLEFFVLVNLPNAPATTTGGQNNHPLTTVKDKASTFFVDNKWLLLAWPAYVVTMLMVVSFWLGERQELFILAKHRRLRR